MSEISKQLLYQRLRNRIIEELDAASSLKCVAQVGTFEAIECMFDHLPIDFQAVPNLFDLAEQNAIEHFLISAEKVRSEPQEASWDLAYFEHSPAWVELSRSANAGLTIFLKRGRFSEEEEERHID